MDPTHHEKIADKLMQYRGKIPKYGEVHGTLARIHTDKLRKMIDDLMIQVDIVAVMDEKGLIR